MFPSAGITRPDSRQGRRAVPFRLWIDLGEQVAFTVETSQLPVNTWYVRINPLCRTDKRAALSAVRLLLTGLRALNQPDIRAADPFYRLSPTFIGARRIANPTSGGRRHGPRPGTAPTLPPAPPAPGKPASRLTVNRNGHIRPSTAHDQLNTVQNETQ
jgi:hypothetical protein